MGNNKGRSDPWPHYKSQSEHPEAESSGMQGPPPPTTCHGRSGRNLVRLVRKCTNLRKSIVRQCAWVKHHFSVVTNFLHLAVTLKRVGLHEGKEPLLKKQAACHILRQIHSLFPIRREKSVGRYQKNQKSLFAQEVQGFSHAGREYPSNRAGREVAIGHNKCYLFFLES